MPRRKKIAVEALNMMPDHDARNIVLDIKAELERQLDVGRKKPPGFTNEYTESLCIAQLRIISLLFVESFQVETWKDALVDPDLLRSAKYLNRKKEPLLYLLKAQIPSESLIGGDFSGLDRAEIFISTLDVLIEGLMKAKVTEKSKDYDSAKIGEAIREVSRLHKQLFGTEIKLSKNLATDFSENFGTRLIQAILAASGIDKPYSLDTIARHLKRPPKGA